MSDESKSIWKKSWHGTRSLLLAWLVLMIATLIIFLVIMLAMRMPINRSSGELRLLAALEFCTTMVIFLILFVRWIFCRLHLKRFLFALACFVTLIALAYAEEDWRGMHALKKFEREWAARGEKFTFKEIAPPPVPDDQNFAMTPVVASSYEMMFDRTGREIIPRNTNVVNRLDMRLVDSDWPTNGIGNWEKATLSDLKPWQDYYRNLAAKTNLFPVSPQPQTPAQDVLMALSKYNSTIEELRQAGKLPYSRFPLEYDKDDSSAILLPHLAALKSSALLLQLRAIAELQSGQSDAALDDVKLMSRLNQSIRTEPFLISHLVRIAMTAITLQPVYEGLAKHQWTEAQLADLDAELTKLDYLADYEFSMRGERVLGIADVEYLRRSRNFDRLNYAESDYHHPFSQVAFHLVPASFFYQNELSVARMHQQWTLPLVDLEQRIVLPKVVQQNSAAAAKTYSRFSPYTVLARMIFPAINHAVVKYVRIQSSVDLARVAIALERYRLAHGEYPSSLDALEPQFMDTVPHDIIDGQPLHYRRTAGGQFVLYSVGWNERDDGGVVGLSKSGKVTDYNQGDLVWRYPEK